MALTITKDTPVVDSTFNIDEVKNEIAVQYKGSAEVDTITSEIVVDDPQSIAIFGAKAAEGVSKASDAVLNSVNMSQLNETSKVVSQLNKIMKEFDMDELAEEPKGLAKIFTNVKKQLDKIISKYEVLGKEIEKIYVQLMQDQDEIGRSNKMLEDMFVANKENFNKLELYVLAGEQGLTELQNLIDYASAKGDKEQLELYQQAHVLLGARVNDLRMAEHVAMQAIPMLKTMQFNNSNLVRQINSAFITTLPAFKQGIAQAVLLKRQKIMADSMADLRDKTNKVLEKNAENTANLSVQITQQAMSSAISMETLEKNYNTILNGAKETERIMKEASSQWDSNATKLEQMKADFQKQLNM